ncbi:hypothetical protein SUGI_0942230 [Cryptomeria japonica]|nr:hypothetical protein SUGI_0942230 [Cryptomeria japonica]
MSLDPFTRNTTKETVEGSSFNRYHSAMDEKRAKSCLSLLFAVAVFIELQSYVAAVQVGDTLPLSSSLAGNQTLMSKNGTFELGFFSPNGSNNWYIGIWFASIPEKTIVWVANRETPARSRPGVLKLADFGLAKFVSRDFSRILTTTRGTRGYLAPEWISGLPITQKVDVYSFGMTLLEIISGQRTLDLNVQDSSMYYFPPWAARQIYKGNTINIMDQKGVAEEKDIAEVRRASVVALLCIEKDEEMRPNLEPAQTSVLMDKPANRSDSDSDNNGDVVKPE